MHSDPRFEKKRSFQHHCRLDFFPPPCLLIMLFLPVFWNISTWLPAVCDRSTLQPLSGNNPILMSDIALYSFPVIGAYSDASSMRSACVWFSPITWTVSHHALRGQRHAAWKATVGIFQNIFLRQYPSCFCNSFPVLHDVTLFLKSLAFL